jgi:hypothetical protein
MMTKALMTAGAGICAILGVSTAQDAGESQARMAAGDIASSPLYLRGPYAQDYMIADLGPQREDGDGSAGGPAASPALRGAHGDILAAGQPGEDSWLQVSLDGEQSPHPVWHASSLPGDRIELSAKYPFALSMDGEIITGAAKSHRWTAPEEPGVHTLRAFNADGEQQYLSVFVLKPRSGQTVLEGYRIGTYPADAPDGFIRLTQADMDAPVSPSFEIGQFICKQQIGHWPKFLVISGDMLERLELLLGTLNAEGRTNAVTFFIMSGFRTPFYNTAIGSARRSRHMYGDASDIYPDVEGDDSVMDDLNGDGWITREDAEWLYDYADDLFKGSDDLVARGIGAYGANAAHGPFVHVDGRGSAARWGRYGS